LNYIKKVSGGRSCWHHFQWR